MTRTRVGILPFHHPLTIGDSAVKWILQSGIQSREGGFYAWYDYETKRYSFLYPEVTGYAIRLLIQLYEITEAGRFLKNAILAGDWLLKIQRPNGAFYCKYYNDDDVGTSERYDQWHYTFDAGICLTALVDLYEQTLDIKYLRSAERIGNWILGFQNSDGSIAPGYHPDYRSMNDGHWSRSNSCHQIKTVIALLKIYEILRKEKYLLSARKLLEWGQRLQSKAGRFSISPETSETYAHAHCYAVEGFLKASEFFNDVSFLKSAIKGARWLSETQSDDGSFWNWHSLRRQRMKVSDASAQALRIWIILEEKEKTGGFSANINEALNFLKKMQCVEGNLCSRGGLFYGEQKGKKIRHVNSWVTMFFIQALLFLEKRTHNPLLTSFLF